MRVPGVLLGPAVMAVRWVTWVLGHVVSLLGVRGILRIRGTRCGYGWIYRYLGVRLHMRRVMMVILLSIVQGHGRTCCLSHTCCVRVAVVLLLLLLVLVLVSVLLSRQIIRIQVGTR